MGLEHVLLLAPPPYSTPHPRRCTYECLPRLLLHESVLLAQLLYSQHPTQVAAHTNARPTRCCMTMY